MARVSLLYWHRDTVGNGDGEGNYYSAFPGRTLEKHGR